MLDTFCDPEFTVLLKGFAPALSHHYSISALSSLQPCWIHQLPKSADLPVWPQTGFGCLSVYQVRFTGRDTYWLALLLTPSCLSMEVSGQCGHRGQCPLLHSWGKPSSLPGNQEHQAGIKQNVRRPCWAHRGASRCYRTSGLDSGSIFVERN